MKIAVPSRSYKKAATPTLRSIAGWKPAAYLYTHRQLLARLVALFLLTATLAGIVSFRITPEVSVVTAVPTQTEFTEVAKPDGAAGAPEPARDPLKDPTGSTAPIIGDFGFSLGSPDHSTEAPLSLKTKESLTAAQPEASQSPALPVAVAETPQPAPEPTAVKKEFIEISVQLTIEDGRVAGAQIGNRQPGAEAFEATALHIARQRRYPPGTSRTETVVVRVANQLGRKEP